ncbi:MAG: hypothetical protein IRZ10_07255 [Thermoflavifilum sp.]|nr:hypothetical protein [Thermoflavifilum sp.]MCL6514205.1 hypothetical protein [Alicyclobacillus sp.]
MLKFIISILFIPLPVFIYTLSFARWMHGRGQRVGAYSAGVLAVVTAVFAVVVLYRLSF